MKIKKGDYVIATKYRDGSIHDAWEIGFFDSFDKTESGRVAYFIQGNKRRYSKVKKISQLIGKLILDNKDFIQNADRSIWWWVKNILSIKESEKDKLTSQEINKVKGK